MMVRPVKRAKRAKPAKQVSLDVLAEMVRNGACLGECGVLRPDLTRKDRRELQAARLVPRVEQLRAVDDAGRVWTKKEDAVLRAKVPARTADQIRQVLPWRSALQIRARVFYLGLAWQHKAASPFPPRNAAPMPRAPKQPAADRPAPAPAWTHAQDSMLALQAGAVPFLVLRERLAAVGPRWSREQISQRFRQLKNRLRVRPERSLVLGRLERPALLVVDKMIAKGFSANEIARQLGHGFTPAMVVKVRPEAALRRSRLKPATPYDNPDSLRIQDFAYPTTFSQIKRIFREQRGRAIAWARANGVEYRSLMSMLKRGEVVRDTRLTRLLGLTPPEGGLGCWAKEDPDS